MVEIDGYKGVPLKLVSNVNHFHSIFIKEHFIRLMDPNKPKGRTLFLLNVPPYVTEKSLHDFFTRYGKVISVIFAKKPGKDETDKWQQNITQFSNYESPFKFKVAYVVFKSTNSVERALQVNSIDLFNDNTGDAIIESGMQLWHSQYKSKQFDVTATQQLIDKYMAAYDEREKKASEAAKNSEADADGWVTVGRQGRNSGFEQRDTILDKMQNKMERSKKNKELTNFYTFQIRESKMKNIIELRKKFEDDKKKIESLKQSRRFRPF
ncbi:ribosomal RNA-processing protein 7 homolog A [Cochliomyia hominivorax]